MKFAPSEFAHFLLSLLSYLFSAKPSGAMLDLRSGRAPLFGIARHYRDQDKSGAGTFITVPEPVNHIQSRFTLMFLSAGFGFANLCQFSLTKESKQKRPATKRRCSRIMALRH